LRVRVAGATPLGRATVLGGEHLDLVDQRALRTTHPRVLE
jgi:hypothetical protein